ncbi:MAG TPA: LemA family protein [Dehalococcoidia bacterium]|jgi:LemA protein|nr:LemA family protein [Dehalococcoidia bacterium]
MGIIIAIVLIVLVVLAILFFVGMYNGLVRGRNRVKEAWSGIDVQLKRRASLIPNLVETVRGYAEHERGTFDEVTQARAQLERAGTPADAAAANNMLTGALRHLFAVAENYPQLQAAQNFRDLQAELSDIEEKIAFARQFYNTNVLDYNNRIGTVPTSIVAGMFGFTPEQFFEAEEADREVPRVDFSRTAAPPTAPTGGGEGGAAGGTPASS